MESQIAGLDGLLLKIAGFRSIDHTEITTQPVHGSHYVMPPCQINGDPDPHSELPSLTSTYVDSRAEK